MKNTVNGIAKSIVVYGVRMGEGINATHQSVNLSEKYLQTKIELAKDTWKDIDADEYLNEVRGY